MHRKTDPEALELQLEQGKDTVNSNGEFVWTRFSDFSILPEGTRDISPVFGESRFVRRTKDNDSLFGSMEEKKVYGFSNPVIAPRGEKGAYELPREELAVFLDEARNCEHGKDILSIVRKWGPLGRSTSEWKPSFSLVRCDTPAEWVAFIAHVKTFFNLIDGEKVSKFVSAGTRGFEIRCQVLDGAQRIFLIPPTVAADETGAARHGLALILKRAMAKASFGKRYIVLPTGQIIEKAIPADLYSFAWLMLEQTALNKTEFQAELRLRKCDVCGDWDLEESNLCSDSKRRMRKRQGQGEDAWYHDACNRRANRRKELERKAKSQGKTPFPRPGARKDKTVISSAAFLEQMKPGSEDSTQKEIPSAQKNRSRKRPGQ
ncbi:hypothetical protein SDC9_58260 [bioreactor metagenome]|uniref:Uncharacterized protein n=1 Tax=bioreactor metagenome TaxID=1076179 RepID=A0A644X765_9ZZZZ